MKVKLCKYISYGFNRKELMVILLINEMFSVDFCFVKLFFD